MILILFIFYSICSTRAIHLYVKVYSIGIKGTCSVAMFACPHMTTGGVDLHNVICSPGTKAKPWIRVYCMIRWDNVRKGCTVTVLLTQTIKKVVYVLLGISPASICSCSWPTFRNLVSVPSSEAGCRLWGVREDRGFYTRVRVWTGMWQTNRGV
jgi:hypothetical protein